MFQSYFIFEYHFQDELGISEDDFDDLGCLFQVIVADCLMAVV